MSVFENPARAAWIEISQCHAHYQARCCSTYKQRVAVVAFSANNSNICIFSLKNKLFKWECSFFTYTLFFTSNTHERSFRFYRTEWRFYRRRYTGRCELRRG